jgi:hypothetical protein
MIPIQHLKASPRTFLVVQGIAVLTLSFILPNQLGWSAQSVVGDRPDMYNPPNSSGILTLNHLYATGAITLDQYNAQLTQLTHPVSIAGSSVSGGQNIVEPSASADSPNVTTSSGAPSDTSNPSAGGNAAGGASGQNLTTVSFSLYDAGGYGLTPQDTAEIGQIIRLLPNNQVSNIQSITFNAAASCSPSYGANIVICAQHPTSSDPAWELQNQLLPPLGRHVYETVLTQPQRELWNSIVPSGASSGEDYFAQEYQAYTFDTEGVVSSAISEGSARTDLPPILFIASFFETGGTCEVFSTDQKSGTTTATPGPAPTPGTLRVGDYGFDIAGGEITGYAHYLGSQPEPNGYESIWAQQYAFDPPIPIPLVTKSAIVSTSQKSAPVTTQPKTE